MDFKQMTNEDIKLFLNTAEFAEDHLIDGKIVSILVDNDALERKQKKEFDGIRLGDFMYFAKTIDLKQIPKPEDVQKVDGKLYTVVSVSENVGILEVVLQRNW